MKRMCLVVGLAFCASFGAQAYDKSSQEQWKALKTISTICSEEGTRIIETFAEDLLPNAFGRYEKARDTAKELNQVFNEEFPEPVAKGSDTYAVCEKVMGRLRTAADEYKRQKDELAHLYFRHKAGVITSEELSKLDEQPLKIDIVKMDSLQKPPAIKELEGKQSAFAAKFMPETFAQYQLLVKEHAQSVRLYEELCESREKTSAPLDQVFWSVSQKAERVGQAVNALAATYNNLYLSHRIGDVDAEGLDKTDREKAAALKGLVQSVPSMLREDVNNPDKSFCDSMVDIPGRSFKMGRTEVTQVMWQRVMGNNPSYFKGPNLPVEHVSWNDCRRFIQKLNGMSKNVKFRLPTEEEWEYCCRAGGKGVWGKRKNGQEGPLNVMGWHCGNSGLETHPVAQKEPNAWGLYDMHGNVGEWTSTADSVGDGRMFRGGSWFNDFRSCAAGYRNGSYPGYSNNRLGFRLVSEDL